MLDWLNNLYLVFVSAKVCSFFTLLFRATVSGFVSDISHRVKQNLGHCVIL